MKEFLTTIIRRPLTVAMLMLAAAATGLYQAFHLPLELTPEVDLPKLAVTASWPGSTPENVEAFVTSPIESIAHTLPHVRKVSSESSEGQTRVEIEFSRQAQMDFITLELGEKLSHLTQELPFGVSTPQIEKYVPKEFQSEAFLSYHLAGNLAPHELRTFAIKKLRGPLLSINGIAEVEVLGGEERELHILVDRAKLETYKLALAEVQQTLANAQMRQQVGRLSTGVHHVDLVIENFAGDLTELANLPVEKNGVSFKLSEVARPEFTTVPPLSITRIDGEPAVLLRILRQPGTNSLRIADAVYAKLAELQKSFSRDLRLLKAQDETTRIREDLRDLGIRACFSLFVVLLVLLLFLRSGSSSLVVMATIFFAVLLALNIFGLLGLGLNLLTLAGFALGFGMLVDNAIVVVENIQRLWREVEQEKGEKGERETGREGERESGREGEREKSGREGKGKGRQGEIDIAARGTAEVGVAIFASTLTTMVAFIPLIYFFTGELRMYREYYISFALAVCASLAASLLVAFTLTPTLAARLSLRKKATKLKGSSKPSISLSPHLPLTPSPFQSLYKRLLSFIIRWRWVVILLALGIFGGATYIFLKEVTRGSPWKWGEETYIVVWAQLPTGAQLERADAIARFFEERVVGQSQVERVFTRVSAEYANLRITFPRAAQFSAYPLIMKEQLSVLASRFAGISIGVYGFGPGFVIGYGGTAPQYRLRVLGYNYNEVKKFAEEIGRTLSRHPRVREVNTASAGWYAEGESFETILAIDREKLPAYGLSVQSVMAQLGAHLREDFTRQEMQFDGEPIIYRIKFADFDKFELQDLFRMALRGENGQPVHLRDIAHIEERPTQSMIARENQQYQRWITFEFRGPWKLGNRYVESIVKNTHLPPGYKLEQPEWRWGSVEEEKELWKVIGLSLLLVFMVTAALFESLKQPFIIMTAVPMALIGVFLIFWLTDQPFDRSAYIGVVLLGGIVVNNAIILVDHINQLRRGGMVKIEAIVTGAGHRLRPVLMTSLTTIVGLLPMVVAADKTGLWYALALATIGGMASSTLMVLLVVPALCAFGKK
ncbi:MAG: efflux RND transporter permease subunit [candidate division KSB1 bacterium]|nr:efflux RND transporter permease subunit [candidate division KSB1 bacterium]MDZ7364312.1 efflux RND transporter permease subunit [candidate division KSB1 bacterium]MDZ7405035.1 efflux RND transporter permease subunit [candidate division KSB1 bacterium]